MPASFEPESLMCAAAVPAPSAGVEEERGKTLCVESDTLGTIHCRSVPMLPQHPSSTMSGGDHFHLDVPSMVSMHLVGADTRILRALRLGASEGVTQRIDRPPASL